LTRAIVTTEDVLEENRKIKLLTKDQILISLDRLTRFKPTEDKYLRVFNDIVTSNLISPKYKKKQLELMDYHVLTEIVENIINVSLKQINISVCHAELVPSSCFRTPARATRESIACDVSASSQCCKLIRSRNEFGMTMNENFDLYSINKKLLEYEQSVFESDKKVQVLLENKIDYMAALSLLDKDNLPLNLRWLKSLSTESSQCQNRKNLGQKFPVEKVIIAEGLTEEILLPKLAKTLGHDFDKCGIHIISAGGKNQVVKLFYQYAEILKLPIYVLLDSDAKENYEEIMPKLRKQDRVHVIANGEFEDVLPLSLLKRTLNKHFRNFSSVQLSDLRNKMSMTKTLEEIFKERGLVFKKAEFASLISENISSPKDVSLEIEAIISELIS